jgi:hypothetical protein
MQKSESIAKLAESLAKAQGIMEGASKDATNPFFKTTYSSLAAVWGACRKPLADNGLSIVQTSEFIPEHPDMVCIETTLLHASGEWISGRLVVKPVKSDPQSVGSAITYLRRYSLQSMVGIAPEDDDGNAASGQTAKPKEVKKPEPSKPETGHPSEPLRKLIEAMIGKEKIDRERFKEWLFSVGWIELKDDKPSMSTLTEARAKTIADKWDSALKTYNEWLKKGETS